MAKIPFLVTCFQFSKDYPSAVQALPVNTLLVLTIYQIARTAGALLARECPRRQQNWVALHSHIISR